MIMLTPLRCKQWTQPGRCQDQTQRETWKSKIGNKPGPVATGDTYFRQKRYFVEPGNYEHVDVGGNEEEGVGEGKDDGNAQDGGKPAHSAHHHITQG